MADAEGTKVITPEAILSYARLDTPEQDKNDEGIPTGKPKYSCALVFSPGTDLSELKRAAFNAAEAAFPGKAAEKFKNGSIKSPFRTDIGDRGYPEGSTFINCRTVARPGCVYAHADPATGKAATVKLEDVKEVMYSGCIVRASVTAFYYDRKGNKGVSFALGNLQKLREGDRLDSRRKAEDEFEADLSQAPADMSDLGI
jgi:hypothetical protein